MMIYCKYIHSFHGAHEFPDAQTDKTAGDHPERSIEQLETRKTT